MSFAALAVVVLASLLHATWNLLAKRAADAGWTFVLAYDVVSSLAYAPWAVRDLGHHAPGAGALAAGAVAVSGIIHLGYGLCLQRGYRVADLSVVYPVARGTGPLLSSLGAFLVLGERPSPGGLLGLLAILVGIGLISTDGDLSAFRRPRGHAGLRWGVVTGGLIAAYTLVDALSIKHLGLQPVVINWGSNTLQVALLAPLAARDAGAVLDRMRGRWLVAAAVGVLSPLAYILVLTALQMGAPLSVVAPAREMSMMVGALLGLVVLRESVGPWRLAGCVAMVAGVVMLGA